MSKTHYTRFTGKLTGPLYTNEPVLACNYLMPLSSESDYAIEAQFEETACPAFVLPRSHYRFLCDTLDTFEQAGFVFDLILVQLGAPSPEPLPPGLLAENVFICQEISALLDQAFSAGKLRILSIEDHFRIRCVDDVGDNSFNMHIYYHEEMEAQLGLLLPFLNSRNIQGKFICLQ